MDDPYASVAAMLRWQLNLLKTRIDELLPSLPRVREAYSLTFAKPADYDPAHEHGLNLADVAQSSALQGLISAKHAIQRAEAAIARGEPQHAISYLMTASNSIWSASAVVQSTATTNLWRFVQKRRSDASERARRGNKQRAYSPAQRRAWHQEFKRMKKVNPSLSANAAAPRIAVLLGHPVSAHSSIRRELKKPTT
jgi:hypothetical protein